MFQPVVPSTGLSGWIFLNATLERQTEVFDRSPQIIRDTDYFEQKIGTINTAEELVADRRLLRVALGAFGLQEDINSRAFIQQILEGGVEDDDALANRLADERYKNLAEAFGFDQFLPNTVVEAGFGAEITALFRARSFEVAVGEQDQAMRLALNARRELPEIVTADESNDAKWFSIMGTQPLREVFETLLGFPPGFAQLDLDRQLDDFKERAQSQLGLENLEDLADPDRLDSIIERFLLRDQVSNGQALSSGSIALTLLQSAATPQF